MKLQGRAFSNSGLTTIEFDSKDIITNMIVKDYKGEVYQVESDSLQLAEDPCKVLLEKIRSKLRAVMYSEDEEYETYTTEELIEITLGEIESELENN